MRNRYVVDMWPPCTLGTSKPTFFVVDTRSQTMVPGSGTNAYEAARAHADLCNARHTTTES